MANILKVTAKILLGMVALPPAYTFLFFKYLHDLGDSVCEGAIEGYQKSNRYLGDELKKLFKGE